MERNDGPLYQGDINPPNSLLTDVLARLGLFQASSPVSIDDLETAEWQKQAQAIQTFGSQIPFDRLLEIASDLHKHEAVRSAALRVLGKLGKQAPVHLLVDILRDSNTHRNVRATALSMLGELREQNIPGTREYIIGELTGCLTDTDDEIIRITAVQVASIMGKQLRAAQLSQIKKMLRTDPSWHVRETVALTLGTLGEYDTVMQALYDADRFVRDAARLALKERLPQAVNTLLGILAYGKPAEREQAARALGEMGVDTPIKNLENAALMDKSSSVRKAAVLALSQLEERAPVATLSRVVLLDRDEDVRETAKLVLSTIIEIEKQILPTTDPGIVVDVGLQPEKFAVVLALLVSPLIYWILHLFQGREGNSLLPSSGYQASVRANSLELVYKHQDPVKAVAYSPDGKLAASGDQAGEVHIWEGATGKTINKYSDHHAPLSSISWSSDGKTLVTVSDDGTMFIWDAVSKQKLPICLNYPYQKQVTYAIWSPRSEHLAIGVGNQVFVYDDPRQVGYTQLDTTFNKHTASVRTIAWSPDGKALISGADDGTVIVWLAEENKELHRWLHTDSVTAVAYSSDGTLVASGSQDHSVLIFYAQRVKDAEQWSQFGGYHHDDQVTSLAWVHSTLLASGSQDNTVQAWNFGVQEPHQLTLPHPDVVNAITCFPNGQSLISACDDKLARVWKIQQG